MLRLITDFDGPIMDISERYYHVYQLGLATVQYPQQSLKILTKSQFWEKKRAHIPEREIGLISGLDPEQTEIFAQFRHENAHKLDYLIHDQPVTGAIESLEKLQQQGIDLVVMTMRRVIELAEPMERYQLDRFFPKTRQYCISNDYVKTKDIDDKPLLMSQAIQELPPVETVWMVGDTEADILSAKKQNIPIIAVLSGIRNRQQLEQYQPDLILNDLVEVTDFLLQQTSHHP